MNPPNWTSGLTSIQTAKENMMTAKALKIVRLQTQDGRSWSKTKETLVVAATYKEAQGMANEIVGAERFDAEQEGDVQFYDWSVEKIYIESMVI